MDVLFSTIVRTAPTRQAGELVRLNWDTKKVEAKVPIYADQPEVDDPNPRGNTRGGRGIITTDGQIICASWHTLVFYDQDLNEVRRITHPSLVDLHELYLDERMNTLLVTSTALDAVFELDLETGKFVNEYWPRNVPAIQEALGTVPLQYDPQADNRVAFVTRPYRREPDHLHINAAARACGETFALSNAFGAIINLDRGEVVFQNPALKGAHNLAVDKSKLHITDTSGHRVFMYDTADGDFRLITDLNIFPAVQRIERQSRPSEWKKKLHLLKKTPLRLLKHTPVRRWYYRAKLNQITPATPLFTRGLDVADDFAFVGFSPATIAMVNRHTGELLDMYQYSKDVKVCVHGLKVHRNGRQ